MRSGTFLAEVNRDLRPQDMAGLAGNLSGALLHLDAMRLKKKTAVAELNRSIEEAENLVMLYRGRIDNKTYTESVLVEETYHAGFVLTVEVESRNVVSRRPATDDDRQTTLFDPDITVELNQVEEPKDEEIELE